LPAGWVIQDIDNTDLYIIRGDDARVKTLGTNLPQRSGN
jgi:hypothetical protein